MLERLEEQGKTGIIHPETALHASRFREMDTGGEAEGAAGHRSCRRGMAILVQTPLLPDASRNRRNASSVPSPT